MRRFYIHVNVIFHHPNYYGALDTMEKDYCKQAPDEWIQSLKFDTTDQVKIPPHLADQVIGQEDAVYII